MSALDALMRHARGKGGDSASRKRFPCPAGCGMTVTEQEVNAHLDRCIGTSAPSDASEKKKGLPGAPSACSSQTPRTEGNAFAHMMQRSSAVFSKASKQDDVIRHRFHLHDEDGRITWTVEDEADGTDCSRTEKGESCSASIPSSPKKRRLESRIKTEDVQWSATTVIKKVKCINVDGELQATSADGGERPLELTISTSLPCPQGDKMQKLVRKHSRLSVAQLKSCLQKSIRRRAPLPAVRVAMELVDRSWTDLIRRLPVIVLEDSTLHPDFGFLVWLMVAESKGFVPCMSLLKRVLQIVFDIASCPRQDSLSWNEGLEYAKGQQLPTSISLVAPLFPEAQEASAHANICSVYIRSMLLRAQYGGMKCDVQMLNAFAARWAQRFLSTNNVPASLLPETTQTIQWWELPRILHQKAHEKSKELVTASIVCPGGLLKLTPNDVCAAGIDFHCSPVVDHLLSQPSFCAAFCEKLAQLTGESKAPDRESLAGQLKSLIWVYSSGINRRRSFEDGRKQEEDPIAKALWHEFVKEPFNRYTKQFVGDRLP